MRSFLISKVERIYERGSAAPKEIFRCLKRYVTTLAPIGSRAAGRGDVGVSPELDMMNPGDSRYSFMSTIGGYQKPQGYAGTRWALIGAFDGFVAWNLGGDENSEGVVPTGSQFNMTLWGTLIRSRLATRLKLAPG